MDQGKAAEVGRAHSKNEKRQRHRRRRLIKQTLRVIHDNPQDGDLLMDVRGQTWEQLTRAVNDNK